MTGPWELPNFSVEPPCTRVDPDLFFPDGDVGEQELVGELADLCGSCPVRDQCLEFAVTHNEKGIWAATTTRQRIRMRKDAGAANAQSEQKACNERTVAQLLAKGCTPVQIVAQTGIHEQSVWRARRQLLRSAPTGGTGVGQVA